MHPKQLRIQDHSYYLPPEKIAQKPLPERDASKLLVYKEGNMEETVYRNIASYLPLESLIVFNQTKVIHARLIFQKETGGIIEIFCLEPDMSYPDITTAMQQEKQVVWKCMVGGASKWKENVVLKKTLTHTILKTEILSRETDGMTIKFCWDNSASFAEILNEAGEVPLPPYMKRKATDEDEERYQTIFAKEEGSVAAPTAGLHFTKNILHDFSEKKITVDNITLHVGAGTFQPVKTETIQDHEMHAEWIEVKLETIDNLLLHSDKNIVAVGTTSLRTLESLYWMGAKILNGMLPDFQHIAVTQWEPYETTLTNIKSTHALQAIKDWMIQNNHKKLITKTQIIIAPGYDFKIVTGLVTNFHQPHSTLLLLVAAFAGQDWQRIYDYALQNNFRFLSYGDGSLLWRSSANI